MTFVLRNPVNGTGFLPTGTKESGDHRLKVTAVPAKRPTTWEERA